MGVVGVSSSYEIAKVSCIMLAMFMNPSTIRNECFMSQHVSPGLVLVVVWIDSCLLVQYLTSCRHNSCYLGNYV